MSEALEALKTLRENIRSEDGQIWRQGIRDNDKTRTALAVLMDFASAALEQPSTAEAQARALEGFEKELLELGVRARQEDPEWSDALAMVAGMAGTKAKRIREEG